MDGIFSIAGEKGVLMKKTWVCNCVFFQSLCQFVLNRRKQLQEKKRLRVLKRLERVSMMTENG
jgi:hypothetical protein